MGEVETNSHCSPSTAKRPSPTSVAEVLGIVQLQQQPSTIAPPPPRKGFNNPLPAIGKIAKEPSHRDIGGEYPSKHLSQSFPSPRSLGTDCKVYENGKSPRHEDFPVPRGGKKYAANSQLLGSLQQQQHGRNDHNQLPPISSTCDNNSSQPDLPRSKTSLTRTYSDSESSPRPRSNSNPRPKSARGIRTRSFHGEASHQRILSQTSTCSNSPRSQRAAGTDDKRTIRQHVLLTQRRSGGPAPAQTTTITTERTPFRPENQNPNASESEERLERPSAPSPPSPGLESDSESDRDFDDYIANLNRGDDGR